MSKTEQIIRESIAKKGWFLGVGRRVLKTVQRLQAENAFPGASYKWSSSNINGPEFKSQWNNPRPVIVWEASIRLPK